MYIESEQVHQSTDSPLKQSTEEQETTMNNDDDDSKLHAARYYRTENEWDQLLAKVCSFLFVLFLPLEQTSHTDIYISQGRRRHDDRSNAPNWMFLYSLLVFFFVFFSFHIFI